MFAKKNLEDKQKLLGRLQKLKRNSLRRKILNTLNTSLISIFPALAIIFTSFLYWQVSNLESKSEAQIFDSKSNNQVQGISESNLSPIKKGVALKVPYHKQVYTLSCEVASLQMALEYFQIIKTQDELLAELDFSFPKEIQQKDDKLVWGDPDIGFVGDPNGSFTGKEEGQEKLTLKKATGWGVNNGPLNKLAQKYAPQSQEIDSANLDDLKLYLSQGKPIIWWHRRDDIHKEKIDIYTLEDKKIVYEQMHVATIIGYQTDSNGDLIFQINDPFFGPYDIGEEDFMRLWNRHNREILVVSKE